MRSWPLSTACACACALVSCEIVFPIREKDGDASAAVGLDAESDAAVRLEAGDDAAVDPPNLIQNGDFEKGCDVSWTPYQATLKDDLVAHGGSTSCRVCLTDRGGWIRAQYWPGQSSYRPIVLGTVYHMRACVRAPGDASAPDMVNVQLRSDDSSGGFSEGSPVQWQTLTNDWSCYEVRFQPIKDASITLVPVVTGPDHAEAAGTCFLVDDIAVWAQP